MVFDADEKPTNKDAIPNANVDKYLPRMFNTLYQFFVVVMVWDYFLELTTAWCLLMSSFEILT